MAKYNILILSILMMLIAALILIKEAGNFLVIDEDPIQSDVIVILSGGGIERLIKGAELFEKGYAPYVIISNGLEDNLYEAIKNMGVPGDSIILETKASSTTENALFTEELMMQHQFDSAIIVSSNYHMRRVKSNFTKVFSNSEVKLTYTSVPDNGYDAERWWTTSKNRQTTYIEFVKLAGNYMGFHGIEAKNRLNALFFLCSTKNF